MQRSIICLLLGLFTIQIGNGQIVNTEELRFNEEDEKLVGLIDLKFGMVRNKAGLSIRPGADIGIELNNKKSRWLFLSGYILSRFTNLNTGALPTNFNNKGFAHLRYNLDLSSKITFEVFSQAQFDEIQEIDVRLLNGFGPRIELFMNEENNNSGYLGILYMYEYEETSADEDVIIYNKDNRLSTYLSFGFEFNEYVSINSVTYFQPNLSDFEDYRLSTKTVLRAKLFKGVAMNVEVNYTYDNRPPITVPPAMYDISTGFSYQF